MTSPRARVAVAAPKPLPLPTRLFDRYRAWITKPGRMPRLFAAVSFVLTLETARLGVYLHLSPTLHVGGTHVHHMVTGLAFLLGGGVLDLLSARPRLRAVLFGVGAALVLDEFALIYHLQDVYYGAPGRLSLEVSAGFGLLLILVAAGDPLVHLVQRGIRRLRG